MTSQDTKESVRVIAVEDPLGWYARTEVMGPEGWVLKAVSEYYQGRDECLNSVNIKNCKYGYINKEH